MNPNAQKAQTMFQEGFNCAQAVLAACGEPRGLSHDVALHVAGPFGGGMAGMGETCGAVTGAFMVIGLKYAKTTPEDDLSKQNGYQLVRQFTARFKERNQTICCRELLGCDISTPQGMDRAKTMGLFKTICPKLVHDAAEIVEELLTSSERSAP